MKLKYLWEEPRYEEELNNGTSRTTLMWEKIIYDSLSKEEDSEEYEQFINQLKTDVEEAVKNDTPFSMADYLIDKGYVQPESWHLFVVTPKGVNVGIYKNLDLFKVPSNKEALEAEIKEKEFLMSDEERALNSYIFISSKDTDVVEVDSGILVQIKDGIYKKYDVDLAGGHVIKPDVETTFVIFKDIVVDFLDCNVEDAKTFYINQMKEDSYGFFEWKTKLSDYDWLSESLSNDEIKNRLENEFNTIVDGSADNQESLINIYNALSTLSYVLQCEKKELFSNKEINITDEKDILNKWFDNTPLINTIEKEDVFNYIVDKCKKLNVRNHLLESFGNNQDLSSTEVKDVENSLKSIGFMNTDFSPKPQIGNTEEQLPKNILDNINVDMKM